MEFTEWPQSPCLTPSFEVPVGPHTTESDLLADRMRQSWRVMSLFSSLSIPFQYETPDEAADGLMIGELSTPAPSTSPLADAVVVGLGFDYVEVSITHSIWVPKTRTPLPLEHGVPDSWKS